MLARHLGLAAESGVGESGRHLLTDGGVLELSDAGSRILEERVPAGRVFAGLTGEEIADAVLRDRKLLAEAGVVVAIVLRAPGTGELLQPVTLYARGVPGFADREAEVRAEVARAIGPPAAPGAHPDLAEEVRLAVRRVFRRDGLQKPVVVPVLLDV
jgi:ribonuclease J